MKAVVYSPDDAADFQRFVKPVYMSGSCDMAAPATLHFADGSALQLNVPLCPVCEIPLNVPEGRPATVRCDGCEEEIEL